MAERGAEADVYSDLIEFEAYRRSVGMGLIYRGLEGMFQRARSVRLNQIEDNISTEVLEENTDTEAAGNFVTATMSTTRYNRAIIRGKSQHNILQAMEGPGPARLDSQMMARMISKLAVQLDTQIFARAGSGLTTATFGNAAGNGFETGGVGVAFSQTNAVGFDRTNGRYKDKGTPPRTEEQLLADFTDALGDAELRWRENNIMAGELVGDMQPTGFTFVGHPVTVRPLTTWAKREGVLDLPQSVGTEAARNSGILGMSAYEGRIHNIDIVSTTAITHAANAATLQGYFVPIGSALIGGIRPLMWDFGRFGQGNTGGAAVARTTVLLPFFNGIAMQENLGRVTLQVN